VRPSNYQLARGTLTIFPLRGDGAIAHAIAPLAGGGTLMFLRRVDIATYPLVALRVSQSSGA
jgi:hypothetical protein